ncbi:hypothetical protein PRIPAC_81895 [Pristionchus pacificus]|uniref:Uncharacterized protein n=1 Tax=Pristionchus pacificus TaxID=54126 RepID=A0A2A6CM57_PRIPA|nr:hypothetical protein PRIPAC_81895 [Pristionchus pacificus]|eukprot:PDM79189.1 hypothetical protein PRIPAC_31768 [Pristionchus pacificus]
MYAVCVRVGQDLAQLKNLDSLKMSFWGFSRVLMIMRILIFHIEPSLAPDVVVVENISLSRDAREQGKTRERRQREEDTEERLGTTRKTVFDDDDVWSQRRLNMKN